MSTQRFIARALLVLVLVGVRAISRPAVSLAALAAPPPPPRSLPAAAAHLAPPLPLSLSRARVVQALVNHWQDLPGTFKHVSSSLAATPFPALAAGVPLGADSQVLQAAVYAALAIGTAAAVLLLAGFETLGASLYIVFLLAVTPIMHCASAAVRLRARLLRAAARRASARARARARSRASQTGNRPCSLPIISSAQTR